MKILYLTNNLKALDGWSAYSLSYIKEIQKNGHEVLCLTSEKSEQNEIKEVVVLKTPLKYFNNPMTAIFSSLKISRLIKSFSPDIIHFMVEPYAAILPFLFNIKSKFCLTIHGTYAVRPLEYDRISRFLSRAYYKKIDGLVAVSNYTFNYLLEKFPEISQRNHVFKTRVINNGIDLEKHKIIDIKEKPLNTIKKILFVGQIKQRKGILQTIEALKYYRDNFSDNFIYDIVGKFDKNSDYFKAIQQKIEDYDLKNNIFLRGEVSIYELENYYRNADLFMMLPVKVNNEFEGFGLVFLEANTKGVPCIGSRNCGAQEAILDGVTGYVVDSRDPKEVAQKMYLILDGKSIKPQECIEWAIKNDIKIKAKELMEFYKII